MIRGAFTFLSRLNYWSEEEDLTQTKDHCVRSCPLCGALSCRGLNPIKLAYDPILARWPVRLIATTFDLVCVCQQSLNMATLSWPGGWLNTKAAYPVPTSAYPSYLHKF